MLAVWSREMSAFAWKCYLGDLYGTDDARVRRPARAGDLTGLAPAYIHVGGLDGFLHENIDYAGRLVPPVFPQSRTRSRFRHGRARRPGHEDRECSLSRPRSPRCAHPRA